MAQKNKKERRRRKRKRRQFHLKIDLSNPGSNFLQKSGSLKDSKKSLVYEIINFLNQ